MGRVVEESIAAYRRAVKLAPQLGWHYYEHACRAALRNELAVALTWLRLAIEDDPNNRDLAGVDPDFFSLLHNPDFRALVGLAAE